MKVTRHKHRLDLISDIYMTPLEKKRNKKVLCKKNHVLYGMRHTRGGTRAFIYILSVFILFVKL